ncbi:S-locus receptor kinase (SRK) [Zostera marina]|uniref:Receptor-like serine/threonine-protein kinase n=1 Tax=Zostera marina TaxID=29655 RepID=A0A0K9PM56_ZOSMR|nr:S-locus receptor kinase (SRK) [Zostera marina]
MKNSEGPLSLVAFLLALFISTFLLSSSHGLRDSIGENEILRDSETLVSESGIFVLGFFNGNNINIEGRTTKTMYLGLWYNFSTDTIVWVANRENPITKSFAALQLNEKGCLNILQSKNLNMINGTNDVDVVWSSNSRILMANTKFTNQTVAKLSNSGNLRVTNGGLIWQSFDYPTDTYLPGMKLGFDKITKKEWFLTSWKQPGDPSRGDLTFKIDTGGSMQYFFFVKNQKIFRIGPWNGVWFNGLSGMITYEGNFRYVDNETTAFFTYDNVIDGTYIRSTIFPNITVSVMVWMMKVPKWVILGNWRYKKPNWVLAGRVESAEDTCRMYSKCGPNGICKSQVQNPCDCFHGFEPKSKSSWVTGDFTLGCQRKKNIICGDRDIFLKINNLKIPDTTNSTIDKNMSLDECKHACKNNCSCVAYTSLYLAGYNPRGCIMWFGDLMDTNLLNQDTQDLYIRSTNSTNLTNPLLPIHDSSESKNKPVIIAVVSIGSFSFLLTIFIFLWIKTKKKNTRLQKGTLTSHNLLLDNEISLFDFSVISSATNNFSSENKIGQGGFGSVYKGTMADGMNIAIKRLSKGSGEGLDVFRNEVVLIAKLQHKNLVRLLGWCMEEDERILVFEFMENKSLDTIIFGDNRYLLDWPNRAEIIKGIARGLLYLHQDSRLKIIHRDLKAANILLDDAMNPKITDFGIARLFDANQLEENTERIIGTYGYMSPEYASGGNFSIKSDVFSFGVLLLEIISGRKNRLFYSDDLNSNLLEETWVLFNDQKSIMLLDKSICSSSSKSEVIRFIKIGLLCVQDRAIDRPTMSDVLFMLVNEIAIVQEPKKPAFCNDCKQKSSADRVNFTNNDVTFTKSECR